MADAAKDKKKTRSIGKYTIFETLGKGGYSWVKKGEDTETGAVVALKFMNRATDQWALEQAEQVRTEIKSLTQVRHENVMKLYAYNLSAKYPLKDGGNVKTILLVLEYCPGGELFDILYYADKMEEDLARTYFQQAIYGLKAVHDAGIAHRDLKPQNLLLDSRFNLKLTDFGLSKIYESEEDRVMKTTYVGTRGYQAPELLKNQKYTNACDIFSMGVVLFILLAGYPPFEAAHKTDKWYRTMASGDLKKFWHVHRGANIDSSAQELLNKMLCYRPKDRITLSNILEHEWFSGDVVKKKDLKKRIIARFMQARENRKKDSKKAKDLIESEHGKAEMKRGDEPGFDESLGGKIAPPLPSGMEGRRIKIGFSTFFTTRSAAYAIYAIKKVLEREMQATAVTQYTISEEGEKEVNPFKIRLVNELKPPSSNETQRYVYEVSAYHDSKSVHPLIHINVLQAPDRVMWGRVTRDIRLTLSKYDIFANEGKPTIMVVEADQEEPEDDVDDSNWVTGEIDLGDDQFAAPSEEKEDEEDDAPKAAAAADGAAEETGEAAVAKEADQGEQAAAVAAPAEA